MPPPYIGNHVDGNGEPKCPWCPNAGYVGFACLYGTHQQLFCVGGMEVDDPYFDAVCRNDISWRTHGDATPRETAYYFEGDDVRHDPDHGPYDGDPDYVPTYDSPGGTGEGDDADDGTEAG